MNPLYLAPLLCHPLWRHAWGGVRLDFVAIYLDRALDLSAFRSLIRSELSAAHVRAASTRLVTAEASIPSASANSRFLIPSSLPTTITASLTATVLLFLLLVHSSRRVPHWTVL